VLRRIFGPKKDEVKGEWRRRHNGEPNDLCFSPNIIRVTESGRMCWAGFMTCMGKRRGAYRVLVGNRRKEDHLEDPGVDGRIILRWILKEVGCGSID
jgi:hypothetical protein